MEVNESACVERILKVQKKKKKSECRETLPELSPSSQTGKACASLNFEAHPCLWGEEGLAPRHWPRNLPFRLQNHGWKHPPREVSHPAQRQGSSLKP